MINLRYHIVSLTAVFLAIGIGLTLGSTFLDRATVDNFDAQLDSLQTRLEDREDRIGSLDDQVELQTKRDSALDEEATTLLQGRLESVPVVVISARGVEEADVQVAVQSLVDAGADVQGLWWFTERWRLDDDGEVTDLAAILDEESSDPSRLRRTAIDALGGELRSRQLQDATPAEEDPAIVPVEGEQPPAETTTTAADATSEESVAIPLVRALTDAGFIEFSALQGGPDQPTFPVGTRMLLAAGSPDVPDDLVFEPLLVRMSRATDTPVLAVLSSAMRGEGNVSDAVLVVREDELLRELVSTVDSVEHFAGVAAVVLAISDLGDGIIGHYGIDESASRLLPAITSP